MPEANFSMASLNLAMEIKPADIAPAQPSPGSASEPGGRQESFRSVLARTERGSEATRETFRDAQSGSAQEPQTRKSEAPEEQVDGGQAGVPDGTASQVQSSEGSPQTAGDSAVQGPPTGSNSVSEPGLTGGQIVQPATQGLILGMLIDVLAGTVPANQAVETVGTDTLPVRIGPDLTSAPVELIQGAEEESAIRIQPGPDSRILDLPTNGTSERPVVIVSSGNSDSAARDGPNDAAPVVSSQTGSGQRPGSQWTNVLELSRLLNPTIEREPVVQSRPVEAPAVEAQVRQRANRAAPEVSRNAGSTRFSEPVTQGATAKSVDPKLWTLNPEPATRDSIALNQATYRPPVGVAQVISPVGAAIDAAQTARPAPPVGAIESPGSQVKIDPQALVSDVRQAVLRISADGRGEARLTLHPPELGELVVRLESARNGVVRAEFHTISPLVREALETGITKLTEALEAEGLTLAQADVHLNLQLGAEGSSGESDNGSAGNSPTIGTLNESLIDDGIDASSPVVEWLPEGATISILA